MYQVPSTIYSVRTPLHPSSILVKFQPIHGLACWLCEQITLWFDFLIRWVFPCVLCSRVLTCSNWWISSAPFCQYLPLSCSFDYEGSWCTAGSRKLMLNCCCLASHSLPLCFYSKVVTWMKVLDFGVTSWYYLFSHGSCYVHISKGRQHSHSCWKLEIRFWLGLHLLVKSTKALCSFLHWLLPTPKKLNCSA